MNQPSLFGAECAGGPLDGQQIEVQEVRAFKDHLAVRSWHGEGFYALDRHGRAREATRRVRWIEHQDARFPWTVERPSRPIGDPRR